MGQIRDAKRLVERAPAASLFKAPRHPYTLGLLSSFPPLHGPRIPMTGIPGSPPDLRQLPSGCVFHPRCRFAFDRCAAEAPPLVTIGTGGSRLVACWQQAPDRPVPAEIAAPEPDQQLLPLTTAPAQKETTPVTGAASAATAAAAEHGSPA